MSRVVVKHATVLTISALCGASWMLSLPWVGPMLSLVFVGLVLSQKNLRSRYLVALAYYAVGGVDLLRGGATIFGAHTPTWEGALLWLGASALLAFGWAFADRPSRAVLVLFLYALVPPLSFFDWLSPLAAAGVLFPGTGPYGPLLLAGIAMVSELHLRKMGYRWEGDLWEVAGQFVLTGLVCNAVFALAMTGWLPFMEPFYKPTGWAGVERHAGSVVSDPLSDRKSHQIIPQETLTAPRDARVALLPETLKAKELDKASKIQQAVPVGQTWLAEVSTSGMAGSIVAFQHQGKPKRLFTSVFPLPISHQNLGRVSSWWESEQTIDGVPTWASIGYDQLLPWVWMEALIQVPQVILVTHNGLWAQRTGISTIQRNTALAWGRLLGDSEIELGNR